MQADVVGWPGLHRFSLWNGIFYVPQSPARRPGLPSILDPLPAPEPEPDYELLPDPEPNYQPEPDPDPDPGPDPWPARTAPPDGYAYEFGTGRLVLAALNPATGLRGYSWSRY